MATTTVSLKHYVQDIQMDGKNSLLKTTKAKVNDNVKDTSAPSNVTAAATNTITTTTGGATVQNIASTALTGTRAEFSNFLEHLENNTAPVMPVKTTMEAETDKTTNAKLISPFSIQSESLNNIPSIQSRIQKTSLTGTTMPSPINTLQNESLEIKNTMVATQIKVAEVQSNDDAANE